MKLKVLELIHLCTKIFLNKEIFALSKHTEKTYSNKIYKTKNKSGGSWIWIPKPWETKVGSRVQTTCRSTRVCVSQDVLEKQSSVGMSGHPARWSLANVPRNQPSSLRLQAEPQKTEEPETNDGKTETATRPKDEVINPPTPQTQSLCSFYDHHVCVPVIFKCREHLGCGMEKVTSFSQLTPPPGN